MRHTPDAVRERLDDLLAARLRDDATAVEAELRSDLRLRVEPQDGALRVAFRLRARERRSHLRDGDAFLATYADELDDLLRSWGVDPPGQYAFARETGAWDVYTATVDG